MGSASRTIISTTGTFPLMYNQTRVLDEIEGAPYMFFLAGIGIVALALLYLYIYYSASWNNRGALWLSDGKLAGQTVVVTGATSGIGRETAIELSRRGARLILVCEILVAARMWPERSVAKLWAMCRLSSVTLHLCPLSGFLPPRCLKLRQRWIV